MAPSFDPFQQNVTFHYADETPFNVSIRDLDDFVQYNTKVCINYGSQLGASVVLIILLALLTPKDKRKSPVFLLNTAALVLNVGRMLCMTIYFTTPWSEIYAYFAMDYSKVGTGAYVNSIIGVVFATLLLVCVEASLVLQAQVLCSTLSDAQRHVLLAVSLAVASVPIGFRFAWLVENSMYIAHAKDTSGLIWLQSATNILITISICFFSAIFIVKLGYAIRSRRRLGLTRFGAMQVIFVMSCQTMVIPAACSVMQYFVPVPEMASNVLTLLAISLPLTSIWASVAIKHSFETAGSTPHQHLWSGSAFPAKTTGSGSGQAGAGVSKSSATTTSLTPDQLDRLYPELEARAAIHTDRNFGVNSGKP